MTVCCPGWIGVPIQIPIQLVLSIFRQPVHVSGVSRPIIRRYNRMYTILTYRVLCEVRAEVCTWCALTYGLKGWSIASLWHTEQFNRRKKKRHMTWTWKTRMVVTLHVLGTVCSLVRVGDIHTALVIHLLSRARLQAVFFWKIFHGRGPRC